MKRVFVVLAFAWLLTGCGAGAAWAVESSSGGPVAGGPSAQPSSRLAGWEFKSLGPTFSARPLLEGGHLAWFPFAGYPAGGVSLYDIASGTTRTLPGGVSFQYADLQGDHLAYVTSENMNSSKLCLFTLSTDQTVTVQQGAPISEDPQIRGDLVIWRQSALGADGRSAPRIYAYRLSTGKTRVLVDSSTMGSDPGEFWAGDRWVVFDGGWDPSAQASQIWALELSSGHVRNLGPLWAQDIQGDDLYYVPSAFDRTKLRRLNLATGVDTLIASGSEYQNVLVDGDHLAWASWENGAAYLVVHDLSGGSDTRIPAPGYAAGGLRLKGDVLIWLGQASGPAIQNSQGHSYLFAYDASRGTVTRLGRVYHYPVEWATDGTSVAFPEERGHTLSPRLVVAAPAAQAAAEFADVPGIHPYRTAVVGLKEAGIVVGYPHLGGGSDFHPQASLTRAQFAKILAIALQIPVSEDLVAPFSDLGPDDPANLFPHDYVAALAELGILQGTAPGRFSPNATLIRAQMVTLLVRALDMLHPAGLTDPDQYWDGPTLGSFDAVHGPSLAQAEWNCLLDGLVGFGPDWDPWASATRAEATQVLWNAPSTQLVPEAKQMLEAALGIEAALISAYPPRESPLLSTATLLRWQGGEANLDTGGRIVWVVQEAPPAAPSDVYLTTGELQTAADTVLARLGWDAMTLAGEGFTAEPSSLSDRSGIREFATTWLGRTSQGIENSGVIHVRLDARNGRLVLLDYHRGVGNLPVDLSRVISRDDAIGIARLRVLSQSSDATIALESATLKLTNAPAVTGGEAMLIWSVVFTGQDAHGIAAGGWVYIDAYTGDVLRYLVPG